MASEDEGAEWLALPAPKNLPKRVELAWWFVKNCVEPPEIDVNTCGYRFKNIDEAVLFKMTFGGTLRKRKV